MCPHKYRPEAASHSRLGWGPYAPGRWAPKRLEIDPRTPAASRTPADDHSQGPAWTGPEERQPLTPPAAKRRSASPERPASERAPRPPASQSASAARKKGSNTEWP